MRLIDADALMIEYAKYVERSNMVVRVLSSINIEFAPTPTWNSAVSLAESAPTVDAVQVVRCKDCKYGMTAYGIADGWVFCSKPYTERGNAMHRTDWFCADGVRKEQDDE